MDTVLALYTFLTLMASTAFANVVLIGNNLTLSFDCIEANFAPTVRGSGECGVLYVAQPQDACSSLKFVQQAERGASPYVLIARGGCSFEDKVRRAQRTGFKAAIVYDNEDDGVLVAMAGNPAGIKIHAVFVSNAAGEMLKNYAGISNTELWIVPSFENSAWSIMAISFISLLAMSAVLATCFFVRRHHIGRQRSHPSHVREFHGMSSYLVKALPSLIFTSVLEDNCTSRTCAICLEDYNVGEKLRILPCNHTFHALCVDSWLTAWRTFCPICKHDARAEAENVPVSESTPLLSSTLTSHASSSQLSSVRSSFPSSPTIPICISSSGSPSNPHANSSSSTYHAPLSCYGPSRQSPNADASGNSMDLSNGSWLRSHSSHLVSSSSLGYPSISPSSKCIALYVPSPSNAPRSYVGSSCHMHRPLHCSESATSFSPFTSAQSLPG